MNNNNNNNNNNTDNNSNNQKKSLNPIVRGSLTIRQQINVINVVVAKKNSN